MTEKSDHPSQHLSNPVEGVTPSEFRGIKDLMQAYEKMSFQARSLGKAAALLSQMKSGNAFVVMTLAGALVPGGLRQTISDAISHKLVDAIVSTGANMSHDLVEGMGFHHYRRCAIKSDPDLKDAFIDRVYDTYLHEGSFVETARKVQKHLHKLEGRTSADITKFLGSIAENDCILKTAFEHDVPIFIPALNDSEIGILMNQYNSWQKPEDKINWDGLQDNMRFAELIKSKDICGTLICGGGVPRNWAQQVTPLLEYLHAEPGELEHKFGGYQYGILITTDTPVYGGMSGCTFSESISWGKYSDDSKYVTVNCDATIALPLIIGAAIESQK
ncbi:MAG: hypothetical protein GF315_08210 [candidate division Zixibacteria bacterium]|nr:hypothetical protein [candidate division Zixibacteria bacterium]